MAIVITIVHCMVWFTAIIFIFLIFVLLFIWLGFRHYFVMVAILTFPFYFFFLELLDQVTEPDEYFLSLLLFVQILHEGFTVVLFLFVEMDFDSCEVSRLILRIWRYLNELVDIGPLQLRNFDGLVDKKLFDDRLLRVISNDTFIPVVLCLKQRLDCFED